ncbi:hypothetical protein D3C72_1957360 [compost metagenome]
MKKLMLGFVFCMSVGVVGVSAQTQPSPPPGQQSPPIVHLPRDQTWRNVMDMRIAEEKSGVSAHEERGLGRQERQRLRRAQRLSSMINDGRCRDAYQLALEDGDRDMAQRIATVCAQ